MPNNSAPRWGRFLRRFGGFIGKKTAGSKVGPRGEEVAVSLLQSRGYRILDRNVRSRFGEIDLVAKEGPTLCFVEVKARRTVRMGWPEEAVTEAKQRRLARLAQWYLKSRRYEDPPVRFDVVSVLFGPEGSVARTRLIKGAFESKRV